MRLATSVFLRQCGACFQEEGQPEESTLLSVTPSWSAFPHKFLKLSVNKKQIQKGNNLSQNFIKKVLSALSFVAQPVNMSLQD